jgi:large subunit ribosomal protein L28
MGRQCEVSGKKTSFGNHVTTRGKAKYLGGVGTKCTGISRRTFKPNLQRIHVWLPNGKVQTFPLIKASKGSAKARAELKNLYPI